MNRGDCVNFNHKFFSCNPTRVVTVLEKTFSSFVNDDCRYVLGWGDVHHQLQDQAGKLYHGSQASGWARNYEMSYGIKFPDFVI